MRPVDAGVLSTRLAVMHDLLEFLDGMEGVSGDELRQDVGRRLAVERALCQLVDQAVDINAHIASRVLGRPPATQRESFELAVRAGFLPPDLGRALAPSVGMRNILVHDYVAADLKLVASAIEPAARDYRSYVTVVARALAGPHAPNL